MSNLGFYQTMTTFAKKVGGPVKLVGIIAIGGYIVLRSGEALVKKSVKTIKTRLDSKKLQIEDSKVYEVITDSEDKNGVKLYIGDKFRILESDGEAVLIEKIGDNNNPYVVSATFLSSISNFA